MSAVMSTEQVRLVVMVPEDVRAALRMESVAAGEDMGDTVARLVETQLAEKLAEVRRRREAAEKKGKGKKGGAE
jgi:hypothetical protein